METSCPLSVFMCNISKHIILVALLLVFSNLKAQLHCGLVEIDPNTTVDATMTFDSFSEYSGGITMNSVARVRIRVEDQAVVDPLCSWNLTMQVKNNPSAGTPPSEWEELVQYGSGFANNPTIGDLQIRVRNSCTTSPIDGLFQNFSNHGDLIDIIAPMLPKTPAGSCTDNVNGPGSYITNYDEFNFDIDLRVSPGFTYNPGIYQLQISFHLEENP